MDNASAVSLLKALEKKMYAYNHAMGLMYLDGDTCAPSGSYMARGESLGLLSEVSYGLLVNDAVRDLLHYIRDHAAELDRQSVREAQVLLEQYEENTCIPVEEFVAYTKLVNDAGAVWHEAKEKSDFALFRPYLEQIVETNRRFARYRKPETDPYDTLLDTYEKGASRATLDPFFAALRKDLVPLIHAIGEKPAPRTDFLHRTAPIAQQRVFSDKLMAMMGIDRAYCAIGETEHPFTTNFSKWDVRITTHYFENDAVSSMYSVIHEGGHALYELGTADELQYGCLATGASMGVHESQSRFYENLIGRSLPFCRAVLPVMRESFPGLYDDVTAEELYRGVNLAQPSLIRTEADELTYSLHIMIRYELEKRLMAGTLAVADLPEAWNAMYKEYLGVDVPDDKQGVLQDSHWSGGSLGYFPSYALGSAYGAQMLVRMKEDLDVDAAAASGDLTPITAWLREKIHRYGLLLTPAQLVENACGAPFDPTFYTRYLTEKFTALYDL